MPDNEAVVYGHTFITSHQRDEQLVIEAVRAGRTRWPIEKANHNTLKTQGYHFTHHFRHGQYHLAALLATLIILAFRVHTRLEWLDENFKRLRQQLPSTRRLFKNLLTLTTSICFDSWPALLTLRFQGWVSRHPVHTGILNSIST